MDLSLEAVLLTFFVVVPGFTYLGASSVFATPARIAPSDLQVVLRSLAISAALLGLELLIIVVAAAFWADLNNEIDVLLRSGLEQYGKAHPLRVPFAAIALTLGNMAALGGLGWREIPQKWIRTQQSSRGVSSFRVWVDVINSISPAPIAIIGARVYLTSGGVYAGALANWSLVGEEQGGPDIALWRPVFLSPAMEAQWEPRGRAVVIPAREIRAFELYTE